MALIGCLAIVLSSPTNISLPSGYYTYAGLSESLKDQGLSVNVSKAPDRVILLSIHNQPASVVASDLAYATGDLVRSTPEGWIIQENPLQKSRAQNLAKTYITDYTKQLTAALERGIRQFRSIVDEASEPERDSARDRLQRAVLATSNISEALSDRLALGMDNGDVQRSFVYLAATLLSRDSSWPSSPVVTGNLATYANYIFPVGGTGERRQLALLYSVSHIDPNDPAGPDLLGETTDLALGWAFEPLTGALGVGMLLTSTRVPDVCGISAASLVPTLDTPVCRWESYLSAADLQQLGIREKESTEALKSPELHDASTDRNSERPSERLLHWSQSSGQDLIFPVCAISDLSMPASAMRLGDWLKASMGGTAPNSVFPGWAENPILSSLPKRGALTPGICVTVKKVDTVFVIRNELDFLDEFAGVPESVAIRLDKASLDGSCDIDDLISVASAPSWGHYRGGSCCAGLQRYGEFVGSVPFLALLSKDLPLKSEVMRLSPGQSTSLFLRDLSPSQQGYLFPLLRACSSYIQPLNQSSSERLLWQTSPLEKAFGAKILRFQRMKDGIDFFIEVQGQAPEWRAHLTGFKFESVQK